MTKHCLHPEVTRTTSKSSIQLPSLPLNPIAHNTTPLTMASLVHSSRTLLRTVPRASSLPIRALSTASFDSPFKGMGNSSSSKIPDFSHYRSKKGSNSNLMFQYFMVGTLFDSRSPNYPKKMPTELNRYYGSTYRCRREGYCPRYV